MACFAQKQLEVFGYFVASEIDTTDVRGDRKTIVNREIRCYPFSNVENQACSASGRKQT